MYGALLEFNQQTRDEYRSVDTTEWLTRTAGRRLMAPQMCVPRMSLPEWMVKSAEVRKDQRDPGKRLPPLQNIMPSAPEVSQANTSTRRISLPKTPRRNSKILVEVKQTPPPKRKPLSVELERRKHQHPRLRYPRLAMGEQPDFLSEEDGSLPLSTRSRTGIVKDLPANNAFEDNTELENDALQFLKKIESAADVIGPGSLFYPGFDVPIEPQWSQMTTGRDSSTTAGTTTTAHKFSSGGHSEGTQVQEDYDNHPALLDKAKPHQGLAVGNSATVHLPRLDGSLLDHRARAKKGVASVTDRKYHIRQAPFSHIMARDSANSKPAGGASSSTSDSRKTTNGKGVTSAKVPTSEYLDFQSWGIDDEYVTMLFHRAKLETIRFINMSDNRLTCESINILATSKVPWKLESLQLSGNRLQERGGKALSRFLDAVRPQLRQLDLSENLIRDKACEELCEQLVTICYASLQGLTLARNELGQGEKVGAAIGNLVSTARELEVLDLHWNLFYGAGATALLNGIYENGCTMGGKLRRLNMAWNRLGMRCGDHLSQPQAPATARRASFSGAAGQTRRESVSELALSARSAPKAKLAPMTCTCSLCTACTRMAKMLASVLQDGQVLFHLDLSYNSIGAADCAIVSDGLKRNHTLFGLHLVGNEATVDELGFVVPIKPGEYGMHQELREKANRLVENIPAKLRLDLTPLVLRERKSGLTALEARGQSELPGYSGTNGIAAAGCAGTEPCTSVGLFGGHRMNPSLRGLVPTGKAHPVAFSEEDLQAEKDWVAIHAKAQQPLDFGTAEAGEDVRRNCRCCWICENWVEQRVSYVPGWSGEEQSADEVVVVYAFFGLDGFTRPTKLTRIEEPYQRRLFDAERNGRMRQFGRHDRKGKMKVTRTTMALGRRPVPCLTENGRVVRWTGSRMLPPTTLPIQVIFQVNDKIVLADDLPLHDLEIKKAVKVQPFADDASTVNSYKGTAQSWFTTQRVGTAESGLDRTAQVCEITTVNSLAVGMSAWERFELGEATALIVLEDPNQRGQINVLPRRFQEVSAPRPATAWCFEKSIWANFTRDPENIGCQMFEHDWNNTRLAGFVRNSRIQDALYNYLRKHYLPLVSAYHYYCFFGYKSTRYAAGLPLLSYTDVLAEYCGISDEVESDSRPVTGKTPRRPQSQEMQTLRRAALSNTLHSSTGVCLFNKSFHFRHADTIFVACSVLDKERKRKFSGVPEKGLTRFQFLEAIVRVVHARFVDTGEQEDIAAAVKEFTKCFKMGQDLLDLRTRLHKDLFNEECDMVFKEYHHMLEAVYISYKPLHSYPGRQGGGLSFGAWIEMLTDAGAHETGITLREFGAAFALGKELRIDEFLNMRHMELSWSEFLVCLGALIILRPDFEAEFFADMLADFFGECLCNANQSHLDAPQNKPSWDKDGSISSLVHLVGKVFRDADDNSSGQLSLREFRRCMNQPQVQQEIKDIGIPFDDINTFYSVLDQDGSNDITADELCEGFIKMKLSMKGVDRAVAYIRKAFAEADIDNSGALSVQEFKNLCTNQSVLKRLAALGIAASEVEAMFDTLTVKSDTKTIAVDEMVAGFLSVREKGLGESRGMNVLRQIFTEADKDSNQNLTLAELRRVFCTEKVSKKLQHLQLKEPDWIGIFDALDSDKSGEVSWDELQQGMRQYWKQAIDEDVKNQAKSYLTAMGAKTPTASPKTPSESVHKAVAIDMGEIEILEDAPDVEQEEPEEDIDDEPVEEMPLMPVSKKAAGLSTSTSASTMTPSASAISLATVNQSPPP